MDVPAPKSPGRAGTQHSRTWLHIPSKPLSQEGQSREVSLALPQLPAMVQGLPHISALCRGLPRRTIAGFPSAAACCPSSSPKRTRQPASLTPQPCLSPRVQRGREGDATSQPASLSATSRATTSLHLAHCSQMPAVDSTCPDLFFLSFPFPLLAGSCHMI